MKDKIALLAALLGMAHAQGTGTMSPETHPKMTWQKCSAAGSCTTQNGEVVIDSNWRWVHVNTGYTNCYTGNKWNATVCPDAATCASNCVLEGADYQATYGASTSGNALTLGFVTKGQYATNIGSRLYLMQSATQYQMFTLMNNEFTFDVDVSKLGCGLNGALYFSMMDADGGMKKYPNNKAGAKYGTGYCDSQCARDLKFIGGKANVQGWQPSSNDQNAGVGDMGACCSEMDVWEANSHSSAFTAHPCTTLGYNICETDNCGGTYSANRFAGNCDPNGCDFNPYRMGVTNFYGNGKTVDTSQKFTVVTQFKSNDIHQFFIQGGKAIDMPNSTISGVTGNRLDTDYCSTQFAATNSTDRFSQVGGWTVFNQALSSPWVLVMSLWDDHYANMLWLDSTYPTTQTGPGGPRGDCPTSSGVPSDVESQQASAQVIYSNIRFGPIGSTVSSELYR